MVPHETAPRLTIDDAGRSSWSDGFARDVRLGLTASPKRLASRHLYDEIGSALYDVITLLPEYYLTRAESEILERYADAILECVGEVEIVELGPGDGRKSRMLIEAALRRQPELRYHPIDISAAALRPLAERLVTEYDRLIVAAQCGDYIHALQARSVRSPKPVLVVFLGSRIGNYERADAIALLRTIATSFKPGDWLLLGVDLKKSPEALEIAYDDPAGVTAAFNRNVLARINRELGGTFDLKTFRFVVHYDEKRGSVDSFQESTCEQRVRIAAIDAEIPFAQGERILTESSYKYEREDVRAMAAESGFRVSADWTDSAGRFSVNLLTVK